MKNNTFNEIWEKLKSCKRVLIKLHEKPDGDSLGSCTAMKHVLEKQGIEVELISQDSLNGNLNDFKFSKEVKFGKSLEDYNLKNFDAILFIDHGDLSYSFDSEKVKNILSGNFVINIDHHGTNSYYGSLNYVNLESPSSCSILVDFFKEVGVEFDKEVCLRLLVGICTDTNFFIYGNPIDNIRKSLFLLESGKIDYEKEVYDIISSDPWGLKKLHGIILSNMKKEKINGKTVAYGWSTKREYKKFGLDLSNIRLGITCMQDIKDMDLIFTLSEIEGGIKGGFRSKNFDTTIYSVALGGGGHKRASGFALKDMKIQDAISKVLDVIKKKGFVKLN